ncbi:MAG: DMT family transporter [Pseudomonadota bacterium]|nr:DMT family transporter [Pseudomonadota bacterium]
MLLAGASFALMGVLVKLGVQWFSSHELVFYRSLIALALLLAGMTLRHGISGGRHFLGEHTALHLRRGLVGFLALATFFYAVAHLPLSLAITLNYSSPLFLALLMPWQLNERPSRAQYATVAVGFVGVALLLRPWDSAPQDLVAGLVGLFSGVMAAFAYIHVRRLGRLGEPEWRTVFWFAVVCALGASLLTSLDGGWHGAAAVEHVGLLLGVGLFATLGQLAMTRAYRKGDTVVVAAFAYSTVVFGGILDTLIFDMAMPISAWIGMLITVLAGIQAARLTRSGK